MLHHSSLRELLKATPYVGYSVLQTVRRMSIFKKSMCRSERHLKSLQAVRD